MTRFPFDQFAKDYLTKLLSPLGEVETSQDVPAEVRQIDVRFTPTSISPEFIQQLGLLGRIASQPALLEPYRNSATASEVRSCISKQFDVCAELERRTKREERKIGQGDYPTLWILTPTLSQAQLRGWGARAKIEDGWLSGVYFLAPFLRTAIAVIHQLPKTHQTLWLRILGRGRVQQQAIRELAALPPEHPLRASCLELLYNLQAHLAANEQTKVDRADRELMMALAPLYQEQLAAAVEQGIERGRLEGVREGLQQGIEQGIERGIEQGIERGIEQGIERGIEQGRIEGQRSVLTNFLQVRLGELDPWLTLLIASVSALQTPEFAMMLVQFSMLSLEEDGLRQAKKLLARTLLQMRFGEFDERFVPRLLALSVGALEELLSQWSEVSDEELMGRLEEPLET